MTRSQQAGRAGQLAGPACCLLRIPPCPPSARIKRLLLTHASQQEGQQSGHNERAPPAGGKRGGEARASGRRPGCQTQHAGLAPTAAPC